MSETKGKYDWLEPSIAAILCDYADCQRGSMVQCKKCKACLCLDHTRLHLETCNLNLQPAVKYELEKDMQVHPENFGLRAQEESKEE